MRQEDRPYANAQASADFIRSSCNLPVQLQKPYIGIICGSGLGGLQRSLDGAVEGVDKADEHSRVEVAYEMIPDFPITTGTSFFLPFLSRREDRARSLIKSLRKLYVNGSSSWWFSGHLS